MGAEADVRHAVNEPQETADAFLHSGLNSAYRLSIGDKETLGNAGTATTITAVTLGPKPFTKVVKPNANGRVVEGEAGTSAKTVTDTAPSSERRTSGLPENVVDPLNSIRYSIDNSPIGPIKGSRQSGIDRAWAQEVELINKTGRGTTPWTKEQIAAINNGASYKDLGFTGHHLNRVKDAPQCGVPSSGDSILNYGGTRSSKRIAMAGYLFLV